MLYTPSQFPDINPIEHLQKELNLRLCEHDVSGKQALKIKVVEEWENIQETATRKIILSIPNGLRTVIKAYGTRYEVA